MEDENANVIAIGPLHREPPAWMQRQVRYRDKECRFPGCGAKAYTEAHHVKFWSHGGRTKLENLLLICSFHHTLVHELRWRVTRSRDGTVTWFRPGGAEYGAPQAAGPVRVPYGESLRPAPGALMRTLTLPSGSLPSPISWWTWPLSS